MSTESNNADLNRIKDAAQKLGEHFDSVQIFATRSESGELEGTLNFHVGVGNWFARYGQVKQWLIKEDEAARLETRKNSEE